MIEAEPGEYTVKKLAQHLGVSARTILRDIDVLKELDYNVDHPNGCGGYRIESVKFSGSIRLTDAERIALRVLPELAATQGTEQNFADVRREYHTAIAKLTSGQGIFRGHVESGVDRLSQRILLGSRADEISPDGSILELYDAVQRMCTVEMEYHSFSSGTVQVRQFDPYYIIPRHNTLYAVGYCHERLDYRVFRVSRMRNVQCLNRRFHEEEDFTLNQVLMKSFGIDNNGPSILAVLQFPNSLMPYVEEKVENVNSIVEKEDISPDRVEIVLQAHLNPEFLRWVLQYGSDIEVIGPDVLLEEVRRHVHIQAERYL